MALRRVVLALSLAPSALAYVPSHGGVETPAQRQARHVAASAPLGSIDAEAIDRTESSGLFGAFAASCGVGAVIGWLTARKHQAATAAAATAAAAAVSLSPMPATAMVDYDAVKYQGGTEIIDINNCGVQAYRQFPGLFPSRAGKIASNGPYDKVSDIFKIANLTEADKEVLKKYEKNFVALPPDAAYGSLSDKLNNGMYK